MGRNDTWVHERDSGKKMGPTKGVGKGLDGWECGMEALRMARMLMGLETVVG